jgi:hypothetical protein
MGGLCSSLSLIDRLEQHVKYRQYYLFDQILFEYYNEIVLIQNHNKNKYDNLIKSITKNLTHIIYDIDKLPNGCLILLCDILHVIHINDSCVYKNYDLINKIYKLFQNCPILLLKTLLENNDLMNQYIKNSELLFQLILACNYDNSAHDPELCLILLEIVCLVIDHPEFDKWSVDTKYQLMLHFKPFLIKQLNYNKVTIYKILTKIIGDNKKINFAYTGTISHLKIHIINFATIENINKINVFNILKLFIMNCFDEKIIKILCENREIILYNMKKMVANVIDNSLINADEISEIMQKIDKISSISN